MTQGKRQSVVRHRVGVRDLGVLGPDHSRLDGDDPEVRE